MLDVDHYRRTFQPAGYDPRGPIPDMPDLGGLHEPFAYHALSAINKHDPRSSLVQWSPPNTASVSPESGNGAKSDEEVDENDDDDCRPFTPPPPRERLSYTRYQLEMLNHIYIRVRYPNSTQKQLIAKRVGITREQVKIWFQNRRRKDVIGKKKDGSESDCSKSDHGDNKSDHGDNKSDHGDNKSDIGDSDSGVGEEGGAPMVPEVVMKSVIAELHKFENDPLKSKKLKKKMKASKKKAKKVVNKQQFQSMLMSSGYDMISPPNQVISSVPPRGSQSSRFHHSKDMSPFDAPREGVRPVSYMDAYSNSLSSQRLPSVPRPDIPMGGMVSSGHSSVNASLGCDLPVLSDLLNYTKNVASSNSRSHDQQANESAIMHHHQSQTSPNGGYYSCSRNGHMDNFNQPSMPMSSAGLSRVYQFPFIAEHPMLLSSLRHLEPYRPQPQYPGGHHFGDDFLFQPYAVTSLANPYFTQTSPWSQHNSSGDSSSSFQQL